MRRRRRAAALRNARERGDAYDLVFLDPPYRPRRRSGGSSRRRSPPCWRPAARVVTESDRRAPLELELPLDDERRYGDTLIRIHTA